jgi:Arc/MetJ-type ribon-helix-helix transcriptional regulator
MKRTTVTLPESLAERLESESRRRRIPVSEFVREAIEARLSEPPEGDRFAFIGLVDKGGYPESDQVEEYLKRHWRDDLLKDMGR